MVSSRCNPVHVSPRIAVCVAKSTQEFFEPCQNNPLSQEGWNRVDHYVVSTPQLTRYACVHDSDVRKIGLPISRTKMADLDRLTQKAVGDYIRIVRNSRASVQAKQDALYALASATALPPSLREERNRLFVDVLKKGRDLDIQYAIAGHTDWGDGFPPQAIELVAQTLLAMTREKDWRHVATAIDALHSPLFRHRPEVLPTFLDLARNGINNHIRERATRAYLRMEPDREKALQLLAMQMRTPVGSWCGHGGSATAFCQTEYIDIAAEHFRTHTYPLVVRTTLSGFEQTQEGIASATSAEIELASAYLYMLEKGDQRENIEWYEIKNFSALPPYVRARIHATRIKRALEKDYNVGQEDIRELYRTWLEGGVEDAREQLQMLADLPEPPDIATEFTQQSYRELRYYARFYLGCTSMTKEERWKTNGCLERPAWFRGERYFPDPPKRPPKTLSEHWDKMFHDFRRNWF
ncbi:MAG: hypothetical protein A3I05_01720 [Deltaproteobacteria bacterium RIFCSPLOWO2_02_FULL_44_10]|nr:MAG: hypothetical protein A3C46_05315 [Deltaproteobacteria bacterium RIFCSPHIGHO2_02_FULL_44_16]OGQ45367.1 MAG: hypothetical protein A3I05_01720 [Deltaproteobacteria bacterium RIFCSPLOWO2_02_FULL_44_10]